MTTEYFTCPVCGFPELKQAPWDIELNPSWDICLSCGTHFGNNDFGTMREEIVARQKELRRKWIANGMKWGWSMRHQKTIEEITGKSDDRKPRNWDPIEQLKNIPSEFLGEDEKY